MAKLVSAFGSSHSAMLTSKMEDWQHGFREFDPKLNLYFDKKGNSVSYAELLAAAPKDADAMVTPEKMAERYTAAQNSLQQLRDKIVAAKLDVLVVVGDDQAEVFKLSNMPAIAILYGDKILNSKRKVAPTDNWFHRARMERLEPEADAWYPVDGALARHFIAGLSDRCFDVAAMNELPPGVCEGHAFSFVHRQILGSVQLPIVPIFLNTFDPPNQPSPKRCVELGRALRSLIDSYPKDLRIGLLASGGLSHFLCDEDLDHGVLNAIKAKNSDYLGQIDPKLLQGGSSEIRNWIVVAEAAKDLKFDWVSYVAAYRSPALSGTGLCFAAWN